MAIDLGRLWTTHRRSASAAALNVSGVGAGYVYLRRWWPAAIVYWSGLLLWVLLAASTLAWLVILVVWVGIAVGWAWVAGQPDGSADELPPLPPRHWVPLLVAGVLLVGVVVGIGFYRSAAHSAFDAGHTAHAEGDCETAMDRYDRVASRYRVSFTSAIGRADREAQGCATLLSARAAAADGDLAIAITDYVSYRDIANPELPFASGAGDELATVRADHAAELVAMDEDAAYEDAYDQYLLIVGDHAGTPEAASAPSDVEAMYEAGTVAYSDQRYCAAIDRLEFFAEGFPGDDGLSDPVVTAAEESLPVAVLGCGRSLFDDGDLDGAEDAARRVVNEFSDAPEADDAQELLDRIPGVWVDRARTLFDDGEWDEAEELAEQVIEDYPGTGAVGRAEGLLEDITEVRREQRIRDAISDAEAHGGELDPPSPVGSAPGGSVTVEIVNGSNRGLEVLYTGPETGTLSVPACPDCSATVGPFEPITCGTANSPSRTMTLPAGDYRVVVRTEGGGVTPFYGSFPLISGTAYSDCYYIQTIFG